MGSSFPAESRYARNSRIFAWSFKAPAEGKHPSSRADSLPWQADDSWRRQRSGQMLQKGILIEIKGDWKQMSQCFAMPYWARSPEKPIC